MTEMVTCTFDEGSGRPFCILIEKDFSRDRKDQLIQLLVKALSIKSRVCVIETETVTDENWKTISNQLYERVEKTETKKKIRNGSYIAIGDTTALLQAIYLIEPKLIRSSVLVNPHTQSHPTSWKRLVNTVESWLPLGLPLRGSGASFDARSELHRLRAPTLIVTLSDASQYEINQATLSAIRMPTAWYTHIEDINELASVILEFQDVPAKCPQKGKES